MRFLTFLALVLSLHTFAEDHSESVRPTVSVRPIADDEPQAVICFRKLETEAPETGTYTPFEELGTGEYVPGQELGTGTYTPTPSSLPVVEVDPQQKEFQGRFVGNVFVTDNFYVSSPNRALSQRIGLEAERHRCTLAREWVGVDLPNFSKKCPIRVRTGPNLGSSGATSFVFDRGNVFNFDMKINGTPVALLDSVLPHEVLHTVFAQYFKQPVPRWADEGACSLIENNRERKKLRRGLIEYLRTGRGIEFNTMLSMSHYPRDILPLYAQGHSLTEFLVGKKGKRTFINFLRAAMTNGEWTEAINDHYGYATPARLHQDWMNAVQQGVQNGHYQ